MGASGESSRYLHLLGADLEASIPALLDRYLSALSENANPLGTVAAQWPATRDHARLILRDCARTLRAAEPADHARTPRRALPAAWGHAPPESTGPHPLLARARLLDVLRALEILTDLTLERLGELVAAFPGEDRVLLLSHAAAALNRATAARAQSAALSYDAHLLRQVEEANAHRHSRLAGEIHDRIGSSLALAFCHLQLYRADAAAGRSTDDRITALEESLREVVGFTQRLVAGLGPEGLIRGLRTSLRQDAEVLNLHGIPVRIEVSGDENWLPARHRSELFLVLREFLRNSFAHASPSQITVDVRITPNRVDAQAADDGHGFRLPSPARSHGGLHTMRERVTALNGEYALTSAPGSGTRLWLWVPLTEHGAAALPTDPATELSERVAD
ncbi:sensor histidine kinase [Marinactinospora rubrisoli]|uniref:Sensor histidine kinase n=1 Tax=Marinactinospora rubrisoli TaxID=2715399 RepID=A0ABW2KQ98_9ACTN